MPDEPTQSISESENPVIAAPEPKAGARPRSNRDWWPNQPDLRVLAANEHHGAPLAELDYRSLVATLDVDAVRSDLIDLMTDSQDWWPADYGHYGPMFIRMTWHAAGTYRIADGRGGAGLGMQRFAPLNSWPDNANLDKARRLLWPVKKKYGRSLSWSDLLVLAGNVALESMGFETFGFAFGRPDVYEPEEVFWGPEDTWLGDERYAGERELQGPLGAVQMGLIYVNPEGPNGVPDPLDAAHDIRETFARMAMNDEETVALIAGGHTFGKCHGAGDPSLVGPEPEGCPVQHLGIGWRSEFGTGRGSDAITSGLEGAWTPTPTQWDNTYFETLFGYEWELTESPAGAKQWTPAGGAGADTVPDAHDPALRHAPMMATTDLALRFDPIYEPISRRFLEHPDELRLAFAKAWYKLLHRDMGPVSRLVGPWVPAPQLWQDPVPETDYELVSTTEITHLKDRLLTSGLTVPQLVRTAWASASTFRRTDKRGGANGARIRLAPQRAWEVNDPDELDEVLPVLERLCDDFNGAATGDVQISLADLIVLGGCAAVEKAADDAGFTISVPFTPGRTDATEDMTDADALGVLEPPADGFRNYLRPGEKLPPEILLVDRAFMLGMTATELVVVLAGMRALGANAGGTPHGVLTDRPGTLTNDFLVNLLDMETEWAPSNLTDGVFEGRSRTTGEVGWTATEVDLTIGANSQLRAIAEVYAADDAQERFVADFVAAWDKVMNLDRFDLH